MSEPAAPAERAVLTDRDERRMRSVILEWLNEAGVEDAQTLARKIAANLRPTIDAERVAAPASPVASTPWLPKILIASLGLVSGLHENLGEIENVGDQDDARDIDSARVYLEAAFWKLETVLARLDETVALGVSDG